MEDPAVSSEHSLVVFVMSPWVWPTIISVVAVLRVWTMEAVQSSLKWAVLPRCSQVAGLVTQVLPDQAVAPCYQTAGDLDPGWAGVVMALAMPCWDDLKGRRMEVRPRWAMAKAAVKEVLGALLTACGSRFSCW